MAKFYVRKENFKDDFDETRTYSLSHSITTYDSL